MFVKIERINEGILFMVTKKDAQTPYHKVGERGRAALNNAVDWYITSVRKAFKASGIDFAYGPDKDWIRERNHPDVTLLLPAEKFSFDGEAPEFREKILSCYLDPLDRVHESNPQVDLAEDSVKYFRVGSF